jgi:hypothetical protein
MPDDNEATLDRLSRMLGGIYDSQRGTILAALDENAKGVRSVAEECATDPNVDSPAALFVSRIKSGDHLREDDGGPMRTKPREAFRRLYTTKLDELRDTTDLDENATVEAALDYAVGYLDRCRLSAYPPGETALTLEDELRVELRRPRVETTGAARSLMLIEWKIIARSLHDPRIAAMHRALMEQCAIPGRPTHQEARDGRAALIAEIEALRVPPRPIVPAEQVEGFATIGDATGAAGALE